MQETGAALRISWGGSRLVACLSCITLSNMLFCLGNFLWDGLRPFRLGQLDAETAPLVRATGLRVGLGWMAEKGQRPYGLWEGEKGGRARPS